MNASTSPFGTQSLSEVQSYVAGYLKAYALLTQVRPKPVDKLVEGLYDGFFRSRRKGLSTREEESIDDL
ncbi:hypothetical protein HYV85_04920, partial [Candidatus Woesearchaeota archaeon]|nr:hypothetical protein [Candidatus Woesearchaeota archaeon]